MKATHDPVSPGYVPAYDDPRLEIERLERCVQQQVEDLFTTITRINQIAHTEAMVTDDSRWRTLREGLRCWRLAVRQTI